MNTALVVQRNPERICPSGSGSQSREMVGSQLDQMTAARCELRSWLLGRHPPGPAS
jgi:hypothetical protein